VNIDEVFKEFRARFLGKCSPVHFWWGSFDHAVTRFSGRLAPRVKAPIRLLRKPIRTNASATDLAGRYGVEAAFYSYTAPEPAKLPESLIEQKRRLL